MRVAIMQPYLFPYIGYWQLIHAVDCFVLLDDVNYIRRGWIARNRYRCEERIHWFHVPISKASQNKFICDTEVFPDSVYRRNIIKTLNYAYRKCPYTKDVLPIIEEAFMSDGFYITDLVHHSLNSLCKILEIKTPILRASDLRTRNHLKGIEGVIELCQILSADCYLNPIGGKKLYTDTPFQRESIELSFLQTNFDNLKKEFGEDEYDLSIIDLLCRYGKDQVMLMLDCYDTIK